MRILKMLVVAGSLSIISFGGAFAELNLNDIHVRAVTRRPKCELPEGFIETFNCGSLYYRLRVQRKYSNPPDPHILWC